MAISKRAFFFFSQASVNTVKIFTLRLGAWEEFHKFDNP